MARRKASGVPNVKRRQSSIVEMIDLQRSADRQLHRDAFLAAEKSRGLVLGRILVEHAAEMNADELQLQVAGYTIVVRATTST